MMKLYLVRHAKAADGSKDPDRHLTRSGKRDARALGKTLRPHKIRLKTVWHSGLARAVETAEEVIPYLGGPAKLAKRRGLAPDDSPSKAARMLEAIADDLMIVGHEPFLGRLVARLVLSGSSKPPVRLRKPSVVCLEHDQSGWQISWMLPVRT